ncbi:FHA domain-containing protein, partial [Streptomyces sp. AK04-3B]|uniref:FHA domain-containing protein n=1 Tax=Streptomyces sp. AK04-3B TaxID=3028650 RepID=UPI0029B85827
MQIRLTVVDPQGPPGPPADVRARAASCDVLVTAPAGTALAEVASALASAVCGEGSASSPSAAAVVLYAGVERLDGRRCTLGEPPLIDGAVLSLGAPADPEPHPEVDEAPARLHVVAGPDAGGVHLLHGGQVRVGRSADADIPLDDPDVSRLHCTVTLSADGRVTVADLGSTNGTALDGTRVQDRPVRLAPGALLRVGESALRLAPPGGPGPRVATTPDGEGHVRVPCGDTAADPTAGPSGGAPTGLAGPLSPAGPTGPSGRAESAGPTGATGHAYGTADRSASGEARGERLRGAREIPLASHVVPGQGAAPRIESRLAGDGSTRAAGEGSAATHGGHAGLGSFTAAHDEDARGPHTAHPAAADAGTGVGPRHDSRSSDGPSSPLGDAPGGPGEVDPAGAGRKGTPLRGTDVPAGVRRRGGLSAWARRLAGGRG